MDVITNEGPPIVRLSLYIKRGQCLIQTLYKGAFFSSPLFSLRC